LKELKAEIKARRLRSLEELAGWIEERKEGLRLSAPCLRGYCRLIGVRLPARVRDAPKPKPAPVRPYLWSTAQIAELRSYTGHGQARVKAVLRVGTEALSINRIAEAENVPATTLRLDLKRYKAGGLQELVGSWRRENVLLRLGIWPSFVKWCSDYHHKMNKIPSGEKANAFLEEDHQLRLPLRTVYTHLTQWMIEVGIPLRNRHRKAEKFMPSEGISVRSL